MTEPRNTDDPRDFDAFLDGALSEPERQAWEERLDSDPNLRAEQGLQADIDQALGNLFSAAEPSAEHLEQVASIAVRQLAAEVPARRHTRVWLAAAALLAGVSLAWWLNSGGFERGAPHFQPLPLAQIYQAAIDSGYEPYYECRDDDRFAAVFERRQGQSLQLRPLPEGTRMLGLSYPGGLSRDTTAMLCKVGDHPVMVFVDRQQSDRDAAGALDPDSDVRIFRQQRDGLVYYEVSRLDAPQVTEYLGPAR